MSIDSNFSKRWERLQIRTSLKNVPEQAESLRNLHVQTNFAEQTGL